MEYTFYLFAFGCSFFFSLSKIFNYSNVVHNYLRQCDDSGEAITIAIILKVSNKKY